MLKRPRGLRLTIGGLLVVIALIAVGVAALRPRTTRFVDLKAGTGAAAKWGDTLTVHYVGRLTDGTTFDSSRPRGQPFDFGLGKGMVIKGWDVGLVGQRVGGVRRLVIPPEEAYGKAGVPPAIPPDSTLVFEVELFGIKPAVGGGGGGQPGSAP